MQLVFYMVPDVLSQKELASEAQLLLNSSLYRIQSINEKGSEDVAGREVTIIEALAGEKKGSRQVLPSFPRQPGIE